ncbi:DUF4302 domain-containing protein [Tenacibaculum sp.]|nr:DUF4302 domain-containing protein [Tenacibaculum sp.]
MKQFNSYKWYMVMALFFVSFYSCQDNNEPDLLFNDTPTNRFNKAKSDLSNLLQSSTDGWKVTYFTDNSQLGGFTFLFDFINDTEVKMDSDFGNGDPSKVSLYGLSLGSTLKLTFTSKNVIHELSDGANFPDPGLQGAGYRGDFEFLYYGTQGDDLIFRVNRDTSIYLRFQKASAQDWTDLIAKNKVSIGQMKNNLAKPPFRTLKVGEKLYSFSYNENRRFATNFDGTGNLNFGIGFNPEGITIEPAIDINGEKVNTFTYDLANDKYIATINGTEVASIFYADAPVFPFTGHEDINRTGLAYNQIAGETVETNQAFQDFLANFRQTLAGSGVTFNWFQFQNLSNNGGWARFNVTSNGSSFSLWYRITTSVVDDKYVIATDPTAPANFFPSQAWQDLLKPLTDILFDPLGHYVENAGTLDQFSNGIFTFIPASFTQYKMEFYAFG